MKEKIPQKPVWKKKKPKDVKSIKLSPEQKYEAKERAEKAGRRYPNLIDNMYVAKKAKEKQDKKN